MSKNNELQIKMKVSQCSLKIDSILSKHIGIWPFGWFSFWKHKSTVQTDAIPERKMKWYTPLHHLCKR